MDRADTPPPDGLRFLLVGQDLSASAVEQAGSLVATAADAAKAVEIAAVFAPDVVLIDVDGLPDIALAQELVLGLRELRPPRAVKLVAVSSQRHAAGRRRSLSIDFDAHLGKPLDVQRLVALLPILLAP